MNFMYDKARERFGKGLLDWTSGTWVVAAIKAASYVPTQAADEFLAGLPAGSVMGSGPITGRTMIAGIGDAADSSMVVPVSGADQATAIVVYRDTSDPATSELVLYADRGLGDSPILVKPDGNPVPVYWSASGIFKL